MLILEWKHACKNVFDKNTNRKHYFISASAKLVVVTISSELASTPSSTFSILSVKASTINLQYYIRQSWNITCVIRIGHFIHLEREITRDDYKSVSVCALKIIIHFVTIVILHRILPIFHRMLPEHFGTHDECWKKPTVKMWVSTVFIVIYKIYY